jgi:hypothetical protein
MDTPEKTAHAEPGSLRLLVVPHRGAAWDEAFDEQLYSMTLMKSFNFLPV